MIYIFCLSIVTLMIPLLLMKAKQSETTTSFYLGLMSTSILYIVISVIGIIAQDFPDRTYKDGQIDALTGKVRYKLITNPDSTKSWEIITIKEKQDDGSK